VINAKKLADKSSFLNQVGQKTYENLGDKVQLSFLSCAEDISFSVFIEKRPESCGKTHIIELHNNSKSIEIPVTADGPRWIAIRFIVTQHLISFQREAFHCLFPTPIRDLEIGNATFQDKLLPWSEETWFL